MQNTENNRNDEAIHDQGSEKETDIKAGGEEKPDETTESAEQPDVSSVENTERRFNELNDKYLRLYSEFDNYRKRSMRERADLIRTAGEDIFKSILPVIDDFERAIKASENSDDASSAKEGMKLIYNKLKNAVMQKGLTPFDTINTHFDPDTMEAVTHLETGNAEDNGKVVDEVEKGYKLGDKVIRYAKVVVGR